MTNKSISQLTAGAAVSSTDIFPDVQTNGVGPVKVTAAQIGDYVLGGSGLTSVLPVARGGTNASSFTTNQVTYFNGTSLVGNANLTFDGTTLAYSGNADAQRWITLRNTSAGSSASGGLLFGNDGNAAYGALYINSSTNTGIGAANGLNIGTYGAYPLTFFTSASPRMTLDASGNLGLGVTPSAWVSAVPAIQNKNGAFYGTSSTETGFTSNSYYGSGGWTYITTAAASYYRQITGQHQWFNAASGSAGSAITFTQAMTLTADGNLGLGTPSPSNFGAGYKTLDVAGTSGAGIVQVNSTSVISRWQADESGALLFKTVTNHPIQFYTNDQPVVRIDSSGNLLVGTTSVGVGKTTIYSTSNSQAAIDGRITVTGDVGTRALYLSKFDNDSTTSQILVQFAINNGAAGQGQINANGANTAAFGSYSDARLKENIIDLPSQLDNILALRPREFDYIESEGGGHQIGFVAQEMQTIYPDAVGEREDGMLTVTAWSKTEARLVKAIQELAAKIQALEAKVA